MPHYYNEFDPGAAEWLRELMKAGLIPEGEVDERDVQDIAPDDIRGHRSVHLFAGVGVWSYALRLAGWPDHRPVWTCSCPCQPFSTAGKGDGFADERHLWPAAFHLLSECRPLVCFGEQVASDDGFAWLDLVQADLESVGYTVGALVAPAAGFGAPHGRHRIYWVADAEGEGRSGVVAERERGKRIRPRARRKGPTDNVADSTSARTEWQRSAESSSDGTDNGVSGANGGTGGVANAVGCGRNGRASDEGRGEIGGDASAGSSEVGDLGITNGSGSFTGQPTSETARHGDSAFTTGGPCNGFWSNSEWVYCLPEPRYPEGCWRPVEPGSFPLAHGIAGRVGLLRGYGNGIVAPQAAAFIQAWREVTGT